MTAREAVLGHLRMTLRLHRFEVAAVALAAAALLAAAVVVTAQLHGVAVPPACFGTPDVHGPTGSTDPTCQRLIERFASISGGEADRLLIAFAVFPAIAGMLLGVPLVSRELEEASAPLPWSLSGRRRRWLAWRSLELLAVVLAVLVPLAIAGDVLEAAKAPLVDPGASFGDDSVRGIVVVARGVCGLAAGVLLGLLTGRQLPGVILGLGASLAIVIGGLAATGAWTNSVATYVIPDAARYGDLSIQSALRAHDGRIVSQADVVDLQPPNPSLPPGTIDDRWIAANFDEVLLVVPGSRYPESELVHSGVLLAASIALLGGALVLVDGRRVR